MCFIENYEDIGDNGFYRLEKVIAARTILENRNYFNRPVFENAVAYLESYFEI